MASVFALQIVQRHCETTQTVGSMRLAENIDAELQEVRRVLVGLKTHLFETGDAAEAHWCNPDGENCNNVCEQARSLLSKLAQGEKS